MLKKQSLRNDNKDKTHLRTPSDADHRLSAWKLNLVTVCLRCLIIDNKFIRPFSSASPRSGCGGSRLSRRFLFTGDTFWLLLGDPEAMPQSTLWHQEEIQTDGLTNSVLLMFQVNSFAGRTPRRVLAPLRVSQDSCNLW